MFDHTSSFHNQQQIKTTTNNFQALIFSCSTTQHNTIKEQTKNIHSQTFPQTQPQQITESSAVHMQSLLSQHSQQQNSSMHTHNNQTLLNTQPRTQQQSGHTTVFTASECQKNRVSNHPNSSLKSALNIVHS